MDYKRLCLRKLVDKCRAGDKKALAEWKRRWVADFPNMGVNDDGQETT